MEKIRKIYCEEILKKGFDKLSLKEIKEFAGYYEPEGGGWEVTTLFEGEGYAANTQFEAEVISNQQMIMGMLLRLGKLIKES